MVESEAQDGAEIEVTQEMREAGAFVLIELSGVVSSEFLAEKVYTAMVHVATTGLPRQL